MSENRDSEESCPEQREGNVPDPATQSQTPETVEGNPALLAGPQEVTTSNGDFDGVPMSRSSTAAARPVEEVDLCRKLAKKVVPSLVALLLVEDGTQPYQVGSGTLYTLGGRYFLITAAHVMKTLRRGQDVSKAGSCGAYVWSQGTMVGLACDYVNSTLPTRNDPLKQPYRDTAENDTLDPDDVAFCELDSSMVAELGASCFATQLDVFRGVVDSDGVLFLAGMPSRGLKSSEDGDYLLMIETLLTRLKACSPQFKRHDSSRNILIDPSAEYFEKHSNSFKGMSGCGVWYLPSVETPVNQAKLVGVDRT